VIGNCADLVAEMPAARSDVLTGWGPPAHFIHQKTQFHQSWRQADQARQTAAGMPPVVTKRQKPRMNGKKQP